MTTTTETPQEGISDEKFEQRLELLEKRSYLDFKIGGRLALTGMVLRGAAVIYAATPPFPTDPRNLAYAGLAYLAGEAVTFLGDMCNWRSQFMEKVVDVRRLYQELGKVEDKVKLLESKVGDTTHK